MSITATGFENKTLIVIRDEIKTDFLAALGPGISTEPTELVGAIIDILAAKEKEGLDRAQIAYNNLFLLQSSGAGLDRNGFPTIRSAADKATVTLRFLGVDTTTVAAGTIIETLQGLQFTTDVAGDIGAVLPGLLDVAATATVAGTVGNVTALTLLVIPTPIIDIASVSNLSPAAGGAEIEDDPDFRERAKLDRVSGNSSSRNALLANLPDVADVSTVQVIENLTGVVDSNGLDPFSFEVIIQGGTDADVAQKIYEIGAAGIQAFGSTTIAIIAPQNGQSFDISFSRPTSKDIHIILNVDVTSALTAGEINSLKNRMLQYIGGTTPSSGPGFPVDTTYTGTVPGEDIFVNRVEGTIFELNSTDNIAKVVQVAVLIGFTAGPPPAEADSLPILTRELAESDFAFMTIVETIV